MKREENQTVEYKELWHEKYLEWICGYANAKGGTLYIGVEDGTKKPVGLKNPNKLMEDIPNSIRNTMGIVADVSLHKKGGKDVIRIKVKPSQYPVNYHGGYFYRTGSVKMQLVGSALTQFIIEKQGVEWDLATTSASYRLSEFSFAALKRRYEEVAGEKFIKQYFTSFGLVAGKNLLTNTGALLADECPLKHSRIFCTRWNGNDMTNGVMDASDDLEYSGGLLQLLKLGMEFIRLRSRKAWHKRSDDRIEFSEYPERAVEEALVNALIHRDYTFAGSEVHIDMFDDRLEITSPGGMVDGSRVQDLDIRHVASKRRNKCLADMFERLGYMERKGSGFKKILTSYENLSTNIGHRIPGFESDMSFRVILPNLLYGFTNEQLVANVDSSNGGIEPLTHHDTHHDSHHDSLHDTHHDSLHDTLHDAHHIISVADIKILQVLSALAEAPLNMNGLLKAMKKRDRATVREEYLRPCFKLGFVELTLPNAKKSRYQQYRLTEKGKMALEHQPHPTSQSHKSTPQVDPTSQPYKSTPNSQPPTVNPQQSTPNSRRRLDRGILRIILALDTERGSSDLLVILGLKSKADMYRRFLLPAMQQGLIEYTIPQKPNSRLQKYRLTAKGREMLQEGGE